MYVLDHRRYDFTKDTELYSPHKEISAFTLTVYKGFNYHCPLC